MIYTCMLSFNDVSVFEIIYLSGSSMYIFVFEKWTTKLKLAHIFYIYLTTQCNRVIHLTS